MIAILDWLDAHPKTNLALLAACWLFVAYAEYN